MGRHPDDRDRYGIRLDDDLDDLDEAYEDDEGEDEDEEAEYDDPRVPVLDDVVTPAPGLVPSQDGSDLTVDPERAERLHALIREAVDLALDDALDLLRGELHARLRDHLDERLPELVAEALREPDAD